MPEQSDPGRKGTRKRAYLDPARLCNSSYCHREYRDGSASCPTGTETQRALRAPSCGKAKLLLKDEARRLRRIRQAARALKHMKTAEELLAELVADVQPPKDCPIKLKEWPANQLTLRNWIAIRGDTPDAERERFNKKVLQLPQTDPQVDWSA